MLTSRQQQREDMFKVYMAVFKVQHFFDHTNNVPLSAVVTLHTTRFNKNSSALLCPHSVLVCCMWFTVQKVIIPCTAPASWYLYFRWTVFTAQYELNLDSHCWNSFSDCTVLQSVNLVGDRVVVVCSGGTQFAPSCCIPKAMVGWERRMWNALTAREVLRALEHLRIEIQVHSNSRWCVTKVKKVSLQS